MSWLGRTTHDEAVALQLELHARRASGDIPDTLLLLELESVYTAGRCADPAHFLVSPADLEASGHAVRIAHRGGEVTWHGPGQIVAYPILDLGDGRRDIHRYLRLLEDVLIDLSESFGASAFRREGRTGAWCAGGKVGAIGIHVSRWITLHGTAFNVAPDLARFDAIVACGQPDARATSLLRETGRAPSLEEAVRTHARSFARIFAIDWIEQELPDVA